LILEGKVYETPTVYSLTPKVNLIMIAPTKTFTEPIVLAKDAKRVRGKKLRITPVSVATEK
jgi:hypothetical protein